MCNLLNILCDFRTQYSHNFPTKPISYFACVCLLFQMCIVEHQSYTIEKRAINHFKLLEYYVFFHEQHNEDLGKM